MSLSFTHLPTHWDTGEAYTVIAFLDLLRDLVREFDMGLLLITHDLGVVAEMADRVAVMYAGRIVEEGPTRAILDAPRHPYTARLMACVPELGGGRRRLASR